MKYGSAGLRLAGFLITAFVGALAAVPAQAHARGRGYGFWRVYEQALEARLEIAAQDLDKALGLGLLDDGQISVDEARQYTETILGYVTPRFVVVGPDGPLSMRFSGLNVHFL